MITREKIIEILQSYSYNVEDQAGNHLIVVDDDSWGAVATEVKNCSIPDVVGQSEQLTAFITWLNDNYSIKIHDMVLQDYIRYEQQTQALSMSGVVGQSEPKQASKVKCINTYAGGHNLYMLTLNKEYEIIHNPKTRGRSAHWYNEREFAIIDDNGKKRYYNYKNPSGVWAFLP